MTYNLIGSKNYELTVLDKLPERDKSGRTQWLAQCSCGKRKIFTTDSIRNAKTCHNCNWHIDHKDAYISWMSMWARCTDKNNKDYPRYGGRGITVIPHWNIFVRFFEDMGDPPDDAITGERLSLDRIETDGNYSKLNCKWSTRSEQQLNKTSTNKWISEYIQGVDDKNLGNQHPE